VAEGGEGRGDGRHWRGRDVDDGEGGERFIFVLLFKSGDMI